MLCKPTRLDAPAPLVSLRSLCSQAQPSQKAHYHMKAMAAVLRTFSQPLSIEELEIPALAPGQVLVAIEAAGVCGSDVHMWSGKDPRTPLPIILGHEGVGRVAAVAEGKRDIHGGRLQPGQRVLWERGVTCGECHSCIVLKEPSLCTRRWAYGIHLSLNTPPHLNGCYASHIVLNVRTPVIPLHDEDDPALFVAASCSGATAAHGFELSPARLGDTVVVLGPGPLGAFSVALARAAGAEQVVVIGGTASRLELCRRLGATLTLDRTAGDAPSRREAISDLTHGRGADLVVEASGSVSAAQESLTLVRHGGAVSWVGFGTPVDDMPITPFETLVRKNIKLQGVWVSDVRHTLQAISLVRQNLTAFASLVTHRLPLVEATGALRTVAAREAQKVVLLP